MIPDKEPVNNWNGNSSNVNFDFDFLINSEDELLVLHTDAAGIQTTLKLNIDYTINQTGNADGSYITFPILGSSYKTLGDDEKITLMLNIPIAQTSPYGTSAKLNLKSLEFSLDYIVRLIQMVNRKADRSVKVQEGSENTPDDLIESLNQAQINAENSANFAAQKAQEAGNSATKSEEQAEIATQKVVEIAELHETAIADITEKQSEAVLNIQQELQTAEDSIIESKNIALENIESTKTSSIFEINNSANTTKTDILNQINSGKETAISEIQEVSDAEKVNLQSYVDKAKDSENIATSKAAEAQESAISANSSASSAGLSAASAQSSAEEASKSAANSLVSEKNAATSENNAQTSKNSANQSASNAKQSEINAKTSETNAFNSANTATDNATIASTQAGIATSKASEASTSAQKALASENVCTAKEQSVIQKTTEALNGISTAQTTAVSAVNSAKTSAVNSVNSLVDKAQIWADGTDEEVQSIGGVHSAKGWAEASAQGQIQADWKQTDSSAKDYIRNKPNNLLDKDLTQISEAGKKAIRNTVSGFNLFDTKEVDHILTGDEAIGWALQGSLITNIYPDAVTKIKELYSAGTETTYREIACKRSQDGRYIADIAQKEAIEALFTSTGVADFYIFDSSNNQFYLPKSKWFKQLTTDTSLVNNYNEDGLPNLKKDATGSPEISVWSSGNNVEYWQGLIGKYPTTTKYNPNNGGYGQFQELLFDASKYNSKYGNSENVQPPSSNKLLYYRVGNTIINEANIDVGNILSELQLKANTDLSNITDVANTNIQNACRKNMLLTNNYIDIAVDTILTAEADGYATITCTNMSSAAQLGAYVYPPDTSVAIGNQPTALQGVTMQSAIFVPKGNKYRVWYNNSTLKYARFYYCETYEGGS